MATRHRPSTSSHKTFFLPTRITVFVSRMKTTTGFSLKLPLPSFSTPKQLSRGPSPVHSRNPSPLRSSEPSDTRNSRLQTHDTGSKTDWSLHKPGIPSGKKQLPPPSRPVPQLPLPSPRLSHDEKALFSPRGPSPLPSNLTVTPSNFTHPASPRTNGVSLPSPQGTHHRSYREGLSAGAGVHSLQTSFTEFQGGLGPQPHCTHCDRSVK